MIGLWQVPFWAATDRQTVVDVWSGLARDRFSLSGLLGHLVSYPLETLGCLLPWSPLLVAFFDPRLRRSWGGYRELLSFTLTAIAVTYPSVWLSAGARGRYYMPLYPCFALLVGIVVERCFATNAAVELRKGWRRYLAVIGCGAAGIAAAVGVASASGVARLLMLQLPGLAAAAFVLVAGGAAIVLLQYCRGATWRPQAMLVALAALFGASQTILLTGVKSRLVNDITPDVAALHAQLPADVHLVSFGPVAHRFAYYYGQPIRELPWPEGANASPAGVEYFCFEQHRDDNAQWRHNGRGRTWGRTSGTLPFGWEQVAWIPCDPGLRENPVISVVVGRIVPAAPGETSAAARTSPDEARSR
jgi:hypothetical protein